MTIGQRIAQQRKTRTLSQEALGETLGVSRQAIYKWEADAALPEIDKLIALSRLFGVSVGWLLGVEDDAPPAADAPAGDDVLTGPQLHMVQEIVDRYLAAQPAPRRSPWGKWDVRILFALCGVLLALVLGINSRMRQIDRQYSSLQNDLSRVERSVDSQVGGLSGRVEEILKAQNSLTADYGAELTRQDLAENTLYFDVYAVPKTYAAGMTAQFCSDDGSGAVYWDAAMTGEKFHATLPVALTDSISISVVFLAPDGTRQTQLLDTFTDLYTRSLPDVYVEEYGALQGALADGALTLPPDAYLGVDYSRSGGQAAPADIRLGLFKNQTLVCWAEPCDIPRGFTGFEDRAGQFFRLPERTIPLAPGDSLTPAAVVTDTAGRVTVFSDADFVVDSAGTGIVWTPGSHNSSASDSWTFS